MATLAQRFLTLADVYKASVGPIIEVLNDTSQGLMDDFVAMECNQGTSHIHGIRTGLPSVSWGALYEGIVQSKSARQQVTDTTGFVEALSEVDQRVLELAGDKRLEVRMQESMAFLESMSQEIIKSMFYYDSTTNARFPKGLGSRFNALATSGAGNQIVDGGGTGSDNTSIWFVTHGPNDFCMLYPKGTQGGITQEDMGRQMKNDASGDPYFVEMELFRAYLGWAVKDWRNIVRIANVDVSNMQAGSVKLYDLMRQGFYKLHARRVSKVANQQSIGRTVIYCNTGVMEALDRLSSNAAAADNFIRLKPMEIEGREVMSYRGIPIRETDQILNTEARVV